MKESLKLALTLTIYSVVACTALAIVNSYTAPVIAARKQTEIQKALNVIFPEAEQFDSVVDKITSTNGLVKFENAYLAKKGEQVLGMTITANGPTYKKGTIMIGVDLSGKIKTIQFIELSDTASIGGKVREPMFKDQFNGKSAQDEFVVGKDIDGISGATISSKGVSRIVGVASSVAYNFLTNNVQREGN